MNSGFKSLVAGIGLLALAGQAQAGVLLADLNVPATGSGLPAMSYGTITVTDNGGGGVDVVVDLVDFVNFVNTGGPHTPFAFNLNTSIDLSSLPVSGLDSPFAAQSPAAATPFGVFNYGIGMPENGNGWSHSYAWTACVHDCQYRYGKLQREQCRVLVRCGPRL